RAHLPRLRRRRPSRRHRRQRPDAAGTPRERPLSVLQTRRGGGERTILVAAVGNLWLGDDGFAGEVAKRLRERGVPEDVAVADFGTGGLDLAYEVMRGYDALVLVDISRQRGEPGTLYVMEVDPDTIEAGIEDGAMIDPHGMD